MNISVYTSSLLRTFRKIQLPYILSVLLLVSLAGCGGGTAASGGGTSGNGTTNSGSGGSGTGGNPLSPGTPSSSVSSVSLVCAPSAVAIKATSQCAATVQGTGSYNSAVTWSTSEGAISSSGLLTAPASAGTVTVTAVSAQDSAKSGTATVSVQSTPPKTTSVIVACNPSTIAPSATSQCDATVKGTGNYSSAVKWSASGGTINSSGLFTAAAAAGTVTVTATSVQETTQSGKATLTVRPKTPQSNHVVLIMEENQSYSTVVGQTSVWPNLNHLIRTGALATHYYANSHPSIGNYFMLTTGQTLTTNDNSTKVWNVDNIARRMLAAGVSFKIYAEGVPQGYLGGNTGLYLIRHNPFPMLSDIADSTTVARDHIWPFTQFATDLANGALPQFSYIVPDVNDDAHNGTPQQADAWLQAKVVGPLASYSAFEPGGDGVLIVDFDEAADSDTSYGGGHVSPVFWGPDVKVGYTQNSATVYQHQSMLRTIMEELQLSNPPGAAATAPSMSEFFVQK